jgi:hypothetical protein
VNHPLKSINLFDISKQMPCRTGFHDEKKESYCHIMELNK